MTDGLVDYPGAYIDDCQIKEVPKYVQEAAIARKLWTMSETWVKDA